MAKNHVKPQLPRSTSTKTQPKKPSIIIPPTPISRKAPPIASLYEVEKTLSPPNYRSYSSQTTLACTSPTSFTDAPVPDASDYPGSLATFSTATSATARSEITAAHIMNPEINAIAEMFAAMKHTLCQLHSSFDLLGEQAETMISLGLDIKATEELKLLRSELEDQIIRQQAELQDVRRLLESKVKEALAERLKAQAYEMVKDCVSKKIKEKVHLELAAQIPKGLHQDLQVNRREMLEIQSDLHNSEARQYNSSLQSASLTVPLRPLLRPLPTPEQSPAYVISRSFSSGVSTYSSPLTAYPRVPASTPITAPPPAFLAPPRGGSSLEAIPPTPSPLFPRDLKSLFSLGPDAARNLLRDYDLDGGSNNEDISPGSGIERPKPRAFARVSVNSTDSSPTSTEFGVKVNSREDDLNKFMAHIGVPFVMIPAPVSKTSSGETSPGGQRQSSPFIVNTEGGGH
ncbi:hypothetical protein BDQ12DRAFT_717999 [Crucibulum laeve]|uniref:Uncharacterized protein n=1 Tax=Crucibulum laeve TaxID=68775 RepID=A0A5C3MKE8_9AGAR|nr:hypothetical protein BDQ12DRAFT_717999 [Crucibulum laeve]